MSRIQHEKFNFSFKSYLIELLGKDYENDFSKETESYFKSVEGISDEISFILKTHLFVENQLDKIISKVLPEGEKLLKEGNLTFKQKLLLTQSFDLIDLQLIDVAKKLNDIRNDIAHDLNYKIDDRIVDKLGRPLGKKYSQLIKKNYFKKFEDDIKRLNVSDKIAIKLRILFTYFVGPFEQQLTNATKKILNN
jgi:hypothetical protein